MRLTFFPLIFVFSGLAGCASNSTGTSAGIDPNSPYAFLKSAAFQPAKLDGFGNATQLIIGNFSNDAFPDIVELSQAAGLVYYANTEGKGFAAGTRISANFQNHVAGALIPAEGATTALGFVTADTTTGTLRRFSNSVGAFTQVAGYDLPGNPVQSLAVAGNFVFALTSPGNSFITKLLASDFDVATQVTEFNAVPGKVLGVDLNADGFKDFLVFANAGTVAPGIYKGSASAVPTLVPSNPVGRTTTSNVSDFGVALISDSAKPDIVVLTDTGLEIYTNKSTAGNILFERNATVSANFTGAKLIVGDLLNADGRIDLFVTQTGTTAKLYKQGSANLSFDDVTSQGFEPGALGSGPKEAYVADFNNDGYLDLVELYSDGSIQVYINNRKTL